MMMESMTELHAARLDRVAALVHAAGVRRLLDLGCGAGALLYRLLDNDALTELVGVEQSASRLHEARRLIQQSHPLALSSGRLRLVNGSYTDAALALAGFDAATLVETIEHLPAEQLAAVERVVFASWQPTLLIVTTPNREYNPLYGLADGEFRDPDHRFEWDRARFRRWARAIAERQDYTVRFSDVGDTDPELGAPSQMAVFERR